jgi:hypothetical protein
VWWVTVAARLTEQSAGERLTLIEELLERLADVR